MVNTSLEHQFLKWLRDRLPYHPAQVNRLLTADAELVRTPQPHQPYIVLKTDSICEEIRAGLYTNPYMMGWMAVTACVSDLAATGASPHALLLLLNLPAQTQQEFLGKILDGIREACATYDTFVVGGDVNTTTELSVSVSAQGFLHGQTPLFRTGARPGELVYLSSSAGEGNAYAYTKLLLNHEIPFYPVVPLAQSKIISRYGSSCTDTSDGLIPAIGNLMAVNPIGYHLSASMEDVLSPRAREICNQAQVPSWFMAAGPHGDYNLLFTIPEEHHQAFLLAAKEIHWTPLCLGHTTEQAELQVRSGGYCFNLDPAMISDLFHASGDTPGSYLHALFALQSSIQKNKYHDHATP